MSDIVQKTIESITRAAVDKYEPRIRAQVKTSAERYLKSAKFQKDIEDCISNSLSSWIENWDMFDDLTEKEVNKLVRRMLKL